MEIISHEFFCFLLFFALAIFLIAGFPVALTLIGVSIFIGTLGFIFDLFPIILLNVLPNRIFGIISNETLIAVPLFIFMGIMLEKSGIASELLENISKIWGNLKGGLAYSVLAVGTLMAASTGIVGATVVTMGILSLPLMLSWQYSKQISTGIICASGTLGQIIPPSIVLVLLADVFQGANEQASQISGNLAPNPVSSVDLFAGAIIPGLLLVSMYAFWIFVYSLLFPKNLPKNVSLERLNLSSVVNTILPPLLLIITVLGSILSGIATPTESASLGALGSFIIAATKGIKKETLRSVCVETLKINSMVFFILFGASLRIGSTIIAAILFLYF